MLLKSKNCGSLVLAFLGLAAISLGSASEVVARDRLPAGMFRLAIGKLSEKTLGGTLWCKPGSDNFAISAKSIRLVRLSKIRAKLRSAANQEGRSKSQKQNLIKAEQLSISCRKNTFSTPTPTPPPPSPPTASPTPTSTPTPTPLPERCKDDTILWNIGGSLPVNSFGLDAAPHINKDRVILVNTSWNGALPTIVDDNQDQRDRLSWLGIPIVSENGKLIINGGTPLHGDHTLHLNRLTQHIQATIPDPNFDGFAILDFEVWWPQWEFNSTEWQTLALSQIAADNPGLSEAQVLALAKAEWLTEGLQFYLETVQKIKELRPNVRVGWYDLMWRAYWSGYSTSNGDALRAINEQILPVYAALDVMVASIYQFYSSAVDDNGLPLPPGNGAPPDAAQWFESNRQYVEDNIKEAQRLGALVGGRSVMAYAWPRYHNSARIEDQLHVVRSPDLFVQLIYPLLLGAEHVAIWGNESSAYQNTPYGYMPDYVQSTLGPMVENYCNRNDSALSPLYSAANAAPLL